MRKGIVPDRFGEGWLRSVSWEWPRQKDIDDVKEQNAIQLKLKNQTGSYREVYGADWREKLLQIAEEVKFCNDNGLVHPSQITVSGEVVEDVPTAEAQKTKTETKTEKEEGEE